MYDQEVDSSLKFVQWKKFYPTIGLLSKHASKIFSLDVKEQKVFMAIWQCHIECMTPDFAVDMSGWTLNELLFHAGAVNVLFHGRIGVHTKHIAKEEGTS